MGTQAVGSDPVILPVGKPTMYLLPNWDGRYTFRQLYDLFIF